MVALTVCSLLLAADPPPGPKPDPAAETATRSLLWVTEPKPDDLQAALANHPDVQIAEAEVRLAQAKLAKAKLLVAQQVTAAKAKVAAAKAEAAAAERDLKRHQALRANNVASQAEAEQAARRIEQTKAAVAAAEADLRALTGTVPAGQQMLLDVNFQPGEVLRVSGGTVTFNPVAATPPAPAGGVADKLRAALNTPVRLDVKGPVPLDEAFAAVLKGARLEGVTVRLPSWATKPYDKIHPPEMVPTLPTLSGEYTLIGWTSLIGDSVREQITRLRLAETQGGTSTHDLYLREYGLLFTAAKLAPPGAVTLAEFAKQAVKPAAPPAATVPPEVIVKVRTALEKTVKLPAMTKQKPQVVYQALLTAAGQTLAVEEQAYPEGATLDIEPGERTVAAWLELLLDRLNDGQTEPRFRPVVCVREYGLLVTRADRVPPGAVLLSQLK